MNKNQVLKMLQCHDYILDLEKLEPLYNSLLPVLYENINPSGAFNITKNDLPNLKYSFKYIVPCAVTIGDIVYKKVEKYFSQNKASSALVLNAMASSYIFEMSSQLFHYVYNYTSKIGLGLSCRISPGDGKIPLQYQKYILERLGMADILNHIYSMTYIYGADKNIKPNRKDHSCSSCIRRKSCNMRKDLI